MPKWDHAGIHIIVASPPLLPGERRVSRTALTTRWASRVQASTMRGDDNPPWSRAINQGSRDSSWVHCMSNSLQECAREDVGWQRQGGWASLPCRGSPIF